jgi:hypothetical protein
MRDRLRSPGAGELPGNNPVLATLCRDRSFLPEVAEMIAKRLTLTAFLMIAVNLGGCLERKFEIDGEAAFTPVASFSAAQVKAGYKVYQSDTYLGVGGWADAVAAADRPLVLGVHKQLVPLAKAPNLITPIGPCCDFSPITINTRIAMAR